MRLIQFPVDRNEIEAKVLASALLFSLTKVCFAVVQKKLSFTFILKALKSPFLTQFEVSLLAVISWVTVTEILQNGSHQQRC